MILGPVDAPETAYISSAKQNGENNAVHLAAYSYAESRQEVAPFGISYMSDSEDGELEAVKVWAQQNPDISDVVIFTMSEDESKKSTSAMFQDTFEAVSYTHLLNPQFLQYDPACDSGINVGYNNREQTVGIGESKRYLWRADREYGACIIQSFGDMRNHRYHGLFGAVIIEPPEAKWYGNFSKKIGIHEEQMCIRDRV